MHVIAAAEEAEPLYVFKGSQQPYRNGRQKYNACISVYGTPKFNTIADHLPSSAVVAMRSEGGGVDEYNFL